MFHVIDTQLALYYLSKQQYASESERKVCNSVKQGKPEARHLAVGLRQGFSGPERRGSGASKLRLVIRQRPQGTIASEGRNIALITLHYSSVLLMNQISKKERSLSVYAILYSPKRPEIVLRDGL